MSEQAAVDALKSTYNLEICKSTIHRIIKKGDELIGSFDNKKFRPDAKVLMSRVAHPELSPPVYDWFVQMEIREMDVSLCPSQKQSFNEGPSTKPVYAAF